MKKLLAICFIINTYSFLANAQDIIIMKNGDEIKAKILEVRFDDIKYRKYDENNGAEYSIAKNSVKGINYQSGLKETFEKEEYIKRQRDAMGSFKPYTALLYGGLSVPLGEYGKSTGADARIGLALGHEGDIHLSANSLYFNYHFSFNFNFYNYSDPYFGNDGPLGAFLLAYAMPGFKFKSNTPSNRFYLTGNAGLNIWGIGGDLSNYRVGSSKLKMEGGAGFAFSFATGVVISNHFNVGVRYFNSKPDYTITISDNGTFGYLYQETFEQKIEQVQLILGYEF